VMSGMQWWKKNFYQSITNSSETVLLRMANGKRIHVNRITSRVHIPKIVINQW
jgi:hypothetical protein